MSLKYQVSICAMYKNEGKSLMEWIEYHLLIGVEHFYLYNNLSSDDHMSVLFPYIAEGLVTLHEYKVDIGKLAHNFHETPDYPYNHCLRVHARESRWMAFIDLDEFIWLREGGPIGQFLEGYAKFGGLYAHHIPFGSSGHYFDPAGLVMENYTLHLPTTHNHCSWGKSIVNPRKCGNWKNAHLASTDMVNESRQPVRVMTPPSYGHDRIAVLHYSGKSKEHYFTVKMGRVASQARIKDAIGKRLFSTGTNDFAEKYYGDLSKWDFLNSALHNSVLSTRMEKWVPEVKRRMERRLNRKIPDKATVRVINIPVYARRKPGLLEFLKNATRIFGGNPFSTAFHYWLTFDDGDPNKVEVIDEAQIKKSDAWKKFRAGSSLPEPIALKSFIDQVLSKGD